MAYKIHGAYYSTATQRALVALEEVGAEYELVVVDMANKEHKSPEFLAHQPWGQVPYLSDGDFEVYESRAIARYVLDKAGEKGAALLGTTPQERALVNEWIDVEGGHYDPPMSGIGYEVVVKKAFGNAEPNPERLKELRAKAEKTLDVYDKHLSKHSYLAGENVTLADLIHLPWTTYVMTSEADLITSRKYVNAWWERISSRDSWKKICSFVKL